MKDGTYGMPLPLTLSLPDTFGMVEERKPSEARRGRAPTPALSSLRSSGRFAGSEKKCQGEDTTTPDLE